MYCKQALLSFTCNQTSGNRSHFYPLFYGGCAHREPQFLHRATISLAVLRKPLLYHRQVRRKLPVSTTSSHNLRNPTNSNMTHQFMMSILRAEHSPMRETPQSCLPQKRMNGMEFSYSETIILLREVVAVRGQILSYGSKSEAFRAVADVLIGNIDFSPNVDSKIICDIH